MSHTDVERARKRYDWELEIIDEAEGDVDAAKSALDCGDAVTVAVVPFQNRPILPTSPKMLAKFRAAFEVLMDRAFSEDDPGAIRHDREDADQGSLMDAACIRCQGKCCTEGGLKNAFLGPEDIQRFRIRNPGATREDVWAAYEALMPDETSLMSCVFHGRLGCTLPREMRSQLCNHFVCRGQFVLTAGAEDGNDAAVILAQYREKPVAVATWDPESGYRSQGS